MTIEKILHGVGIQRGHTRGRTNREEAGRTAARPTTATGSGRVGARTLMAKIESKDVSIWPRVLFPEFFFESYSGIVDRPTGLVPRSKQFKFLNSIKDFW